jgi:hypothetical protein
MISVLLTSCIKEQESPTHLYFSDHGTLKIQRCELEKWDLSDIVTNGREIFALKIDSKEKAVFYTIRGDHKLYKCGLNGENRQLVFDGKKGDYYPMTFDLNKDTKTLYIYCKEVWVAKQHLIFKVSYSGGEPKLFKKLEKPLADIMIDSKSKKLYWFSITSVDEKFCEEDKALVSLNELWCTDLHQSKNDRLLIGIDKGVRAITKAVMDFNSKMVYWAQNDVGTANDKIRRSDINGNKIEDIAWNKTNKENVVSFPCGIALDLSKKKVYWADINKTWVARTDITGGTVEPVVKITVPPGSKSYPTALDLAHIDK